MQKEFATLCIDEITADALLWLGKKKYRNWIKLPSKNKWRKKNPKSCCVTGNLLAVQE